MKRFLVVSGITLFLALVSAVVVFVLIVTQLPAYTFNPENGEIRKGAEPSMAEVKVKNEIMSDVERPKKEVYLRDVPLSDDHRAILRTAGIDVETFVVTEAIQVCIADKLGVERKNEIFSGSSPNVVEVTKLLSCANVK
ncbi:hypothetical protein KC865_01725 [Candidatus Kaiserbacteria bacterium]|nr:hypothetical protein [Candidatus Kaiserbacteria bacterium]USN91994.1 MAG: hypothetical protein H6782_03910 [Candidatus Nomurabacteria bacterium]